MIFLDEELNPELLLPPLLPPDAETVVAALVVTGTTVLVVLVPMTVLPPCVLVNVDTICDAELVTICEYETDFEEETGVVAVLTATVDCTIVDCP